MPSFIEMFAKEHKLKRQDATKEMFIEVSEDDVAKSSPRKPETCAFARACHRAHKIDAAYFFRTTAWIQKGKTLTRYLLPPSMQQELTSFDRGQKMEPGIYRLKPPAPAQRMGVLRPGTPGKGKSSKLGFKQFRHRTTNVRAAIV